jgi:TonB family protein
VASIRVAAFAHLDRSFVSRLRMHAALGLSTLAHVAVLLTGAAPLAAGSFAPPSSSELAVSLALRETSMPLASSNSRTLSARHRSATQALSPTPVPRPAESIPAAAEDKAGGEAREAQAQPGADTTQLASAAPAAGLVDLLDAPRARFAPAPDYPDEARWEGREGRVLLRFRLRADGRVDETDVVSSSGHKDIDAAALATIRRWSFTPPGAAAVAEAWYRHAFRFALH